MKKYILTLLATLMCTIGAFAQYTVTNNGTGEGYMGITYMGYYHSEDGVLFATFDDRYTSGSPRCETLVKFPQSKQQTAYTVPDGVYCIARGAFQGNQYLEEIRIPSTVYYIGDDAFRDCANLKKIVTYETTTSAKAAETMPKEGERREVARYDLQGLPVKADAKGIQIVVYDDYTTETVLNP